MQVLETGKSVQGREIPLVCLNGFSKDRPNILLIACTHGNEKEGVYCVDQIMQQIDRYQFNPKYNFLCIRCLNPDGYALCTRDNANGVNLNRNMPTKDWISGICGHTEKYANFFGGKAPASEPETKFLLHVLQKYPPIFVLTLHSPLCLIDYNGPARGIAEKLSSFSPYPVGLVGYPTPGTFGTWAGHERRIPTVTYEFSEGKTDADDEAIWQQHADLFKFFFEAMDVQTLQDDFNPFTTGDT